ncbi:MAG: HAMP domain-containing protein [Ectothiorhodospiraceae bacterium]|nr:HAMP domain-containing protein [Chromatiales bacterium]MCP5155055.1 HAMP domain-containing protein [Ectothiorhodospiraceae bacterium]
MAASALSRVATGAGPIVGLVLLLMVSLTLMSDATSGSARFGELFSLLLVVNVVGLITLAWLIGWNLVRLLRQVRQRSPGARFTVRMVTMFVVLAVTPVLVVYYFSLEFLHRGIESWFDVRVEKALEDSLELSRTALGLRMRETLKQTELVASDLSRVSDDRMASQLDDARRLSGAAELTVVAPKGHIIAFSNSDPTDIVPNRPADTILMQLRQAGRYIGLDPIGDSGLHVRVAVRIPQDVPTAEPRILQALFPITERMGNLADSVEAAYGEYRELAYLRRPLKVSFTLTLSLVLLLSLLTAVWAALFSARRLVAPLRDLAQGTQAVAAGDYETQLAAQPSRDEVGFLVDSFNEMTRRLARARDETRRSQLEVEESRTYLEAVLSRLSTGVLTVDPEGRLHTANHAAVQILGLDPERDTDAPLESFAAHHPELVPLAEAIRHQLAAATVAASGEWREEVTVQGPITRKMLTVSGSPLPAADGSHAGHVLVLDDITALVQAQRNAAWSEVARRLAHEIKNPLTPIQLSAERLRHKYLRTMSEAEGEALDRLTRTIVQHVEAMKEMVNAFSDYARSPRMQAIPVDVNDVITDVTELYRAAPERQTIALELACDLPMPAADPDQLRQVLHNLIKNAIEAQPDGPARVTVHTALVEAEGRRAIEVRVRDHGPGFPADIVDRVFEPYVTTKTKGTGLGLAIVKKIVEEHGGTVRAENEPDGGASVVLRLAVDASGHASRGQSTHREAV